MPLIIAFFTTAFVPILAFIFNFILIRIAFKILIFDIVYITVRNTLGEMVTNVFAYITALNLNCGIVWVIADLKLIEGLSIYLNLLVSAVLLKLMIQMALRIPK